MDTSKVIRGVVNSGRYTVTAPIVKEDYGLYLQIEGVELPPTYEVDFSNSESSGTSVTMIGNADGVLIPRQFISTGKDVFAFLYHVGEDFGRTVYKFRIPNKVRPDRTNEEPTPEEQSVIDQAISALNEAVAQTAQDVIDAEASAQSASGSAEQAEDARDNAQTYANNAQASATSASQSATASANSATASAQSASDAQGYARSASASAQSASGYASNAQTSANTASAKAQDASGYAQTASTKASESAQSATNAQGYAQTAEQAKTASQTAQGLAESARDLAQGYAEDAQGYAEDAQASAEGISASASQIAQNTADILKAFPTDSASGSIASFPDGADDLPLKSLVIDINPVQDLSHGDPSPENICPISGWTQVNVNHSGADMTNPTTITINLGQTVYGGKLDVLSGELVIDRAMVDLGMLTWAVYNEQRRIYRATLADGVPYTDNTKIPNILTEQYQTVNGNATWVNGMLSMYASSTDAVIVICDTNYADASAFTSAVSGQKLVYELATPIEIQLSTNQINSLYGVNNIWTDSGDSTVEYRADTKLFIERLTAPDSADMIADANIASGQYFMVGNNLFKATANIANGGQITVGTNCTRVSLAQALNEINA